MLLLRGAALMSALASPLLALAARSPTSDVPSLFSPSSLALPPFERADGRCAMRDSCGRKSPFGGEIPCPDNGPALAYDDDPTYLATLKQVCGEDFSTTTCCTQGQLETLSASLAQAEPLIASCPACRKNFRQFYCSFTCSPSQSQFLTVVQTQTLQKDGKPVEAVKEVEFAVSEEFGRGFYESCKDVKFGALNGFAMDLIGGGAKVWLSFLRYMGTERALGSPFQISFPSPSSSLSSSSSSSSFNLPRSHPSLLDPPTPLTLPSASCASSLSSERCACPDCPAICAALPPVLSPSEKYAHRCRVGKMDCFPFALVVVYAVALGLAVTGFATREARTSWTRGEGRRRGEIRLEDDNEEEEEEGAVGLGTWGRLQRKLSFVGGGWSRRGSAAGSEAGRYGVEGAGPSRPYPSSASPYGESRSRSRSGTDGTVNSSPSPPSSRSHPSSSSHHAASLSQTSSLPPPPDPTIQPRTSPLNALLSSSFAKLGFFCASRPYLTLFIGLFLCGVLNLGWTRFEVERDPVKLWVPKGSEVARQKEGFEEAFGPFWRTEQVFFTVAPSSSAASSFDDETVETTTTSGKEDWAFDVPVLSWPTLQFLDAVQSSIENLVSSPSNLSLADLCFAPTAPSSGKVDPAYCILQSPLSYLSASGGLSSLSPSTWAGALDACAESPGSCLPTFGQPINPALVLSPPASGGEGRPSEAKGVILTYVLNASLDPRETERAEEWERALRDYLLTLSSPSGEAAQHGLKISFSTGVSLEEELNAATNTDVPVVVASYVLMFAYVAVALGGSLGAVGRAVAWAVGRGVKGVGRAVKGKVGRGKGKGAVRLEEVEDEVEVEERLGGRGGEGEGRALREYLRRKLLVESKVSLGLAGILLVLLSVSTSVAICSAAGIKVTLVIAEVIPFLVLAIGVDNVFLLTHTLSQQSSSLSSSTSRLLSSSPSDLDDDDLDLPSIPTRLSHTFSSMGPSILLSCTCQTLAFSLGALVGMPAVRNFAIYAAGAVGVNTVMQCTVLAAVMALDERRREAGRVDVCPLIKLPTSSFSSSATPAGTRTGTHESTLARFIRTTYAPTLLRKPVKFFVLVLFSGVFVLSWIGGRHVELGLDQRLALPSTSYLIDYFNAVDSLLEVGPPVFFVLDSSSPSSSSSMNLTGGAGGLNMTKLADVKKVCARFSTCDEYSLANVLEAERKRPESSFVAEPPAVWIDDFLSWTNPLLESCCRVKRRNPQEFCGENDSEFACKPCFEEREPEWSTTLDGFPEGPEFMRYVRHWLASPTNEDCPLGGKASYSSALSLSSSLSSSNSTTTAPTLDTIELSHFRTYHTPLKTQSDFIEAFAAANRISEDLERRTGGKVFPYSVPYVFFQSYATLWSTTREVLFFALVAVLLVTSLLLSSLRTGLIVTLTTFLILFSVVGTMGVWDVSLNPLSLTNLCVAVGIAVEFSAHLARAFTGANGGGLPSSHPGAARDREERAALALEEVGASIVSGIAATKLIGIATLFFTQSALLKTFYAKMWLVLVSSSAAHGLVFLPVILSLFGGRGYALTNDESDWLSKTVQQRYEHGETLFRDDDDARSLDDE
ncbi:hypothetical protein JCM8547_006571 [Rhodosporidiobolus lusitaniae]